MEARSPDSAQENVVDWRAARARRAWRRFWGLLLGVPLLLFTVAYVVAAIQYYAQSVRVTKNYAAELNAPALAVPKESRAWTHYRRALETLERREEFDYDQPGDRPGQPNWQATVAYLRRNREALAAIRAAARIRPLGFVLRDGKPEEELTWQNRHRDWQVSDGVAAKEPSENPNLAKTPLIEPGQLMELARLLAADCRLAVIEQNGERVAANVNAMLDMAAQCDGCQLLTTWLMAISIRGMALHQVFLTLAQDNPPLNDSQLAELSRRLQFDDINGSLTTGLTNEPIFFLDALQRNFTNDGEGNGWMTPEGLAECRERIDIGEFKVPHPITWLPCPLAARATADRREAERKFDECHQQALSMVKVPLWQRSPVSSLFAEGNPLGPPYWFVNNSSQAFGVVLTVAEQQLQVRDAAVVAIALVQYKRQNSTWPVTLGQLSPEFLKAVPPDRFVGQPLKYRDMNGRPTLYSVGTDLDDDGGRRPEDDISLVQAWPPDPATDGDWILWPVIEDEPGVTTVTPSPGGDSEITATAESGLRQPPEPAEEDSDGR